MLAFIAISLMIIYLLTRLKVIGYLSWQVFAAVWLVEIPYYLSINDYYNTAIMLLAFVIFTFIALTILKANDQRVFIDATSLAAISSLIYFTFALTDLKYLLIQHTTCVTTNFAKFLGFDFSCDKNVIWFNGSRVKIILACTGIESMALFAGIAVSTRAELKRRAIAFLISVPVIYVLNLLRNIFIVAAFGEKWFGDESFYIAHHVISKILATIALILISLGVFKVLPEVADLIVDLKDELVRTWKR